MKYVKTTERVEQRIPLAIQVKEHVFFNEYRGEYSTLVEYSHIYKYGKVHVCKEEGSITCFSTPYTVILKTLTMINMIKKVSKEVNNENNTDNSMSGIDTTIMPTSIS